MAPYYNPNVVGYSASATENLQPISAPPINRYFAPRGQDFLAVTLRPVSGAHGLPAFPNGIWFLPIVMAETVTADRIGFVIRGANGTVDQYTYTMGLYEHNPTENYPSTLITSYGSVVYQNGVTDGAQLITINQQLNVNQVYWIAVGLQNTGGADLATAISPHLDCLTGDFSMYRKRGTTAVNSSFPGVSWLHSLGTFNGTLPASVSFASNAASTSLAPRVSLRRSA